MRVAFLCAAFFLGIFITTAPAVAATYQMTFDNNSVLQPLGNSVLSRADFDAIRLFDGDELKIVFKNVPEVTYVPQFGTQAIFHTILDGIGGRSVVFREMLEISSGGFLSSSSSVVMSKFDDQFFGTNGDGGWIHSLGSTWTATFDVLSGAPINSIGVSVDRVEIFGALVPEPSVWTMLLVGFGVLTILLKRPTKSPAAFRH